MDDHVAGKRPHKFSGDCRPQGKNRLVEALMAKKKSNKTKLDPVEIYTIEQVLQEVDTDNYRRPKWP